MKVYIAVWVEGVDSEILGVYTDRMLAIARCAIENTDRFPADGTTQVQKHEVIE